MEEQKQSNKVNLLYQDDIQPDIKQDYPEKPNRTGLPKWIIILITVLVITIIGIGGYYIYNYYSTPEEPVVCTEEAKICPDGSAVVRIVPDCEFAECADSTSCITLYEPVCGKDGKTYSNSCFAGKANVAIDYQGECKIENQECIDTDGGLNYYMKGEITICDFVTKEEPGANSSVGCALHEDFCADNNNLWEYFCKENEFKFEKYECQNGCKNGVCVKRIGCQECPQHTPPVDGWCEDGTVTPGEVDDCGCEGPLQCK